VDDTLGEVTVQKMRYRPSDSGKRIYPI
jgi:hypothetical protein